MPKSVMVWGQSGGGAKTSTLMAMPSAKGLFQRAAVQSGSTLELMATRTTVTTRTGRPDATTRPTMIFDHEIRLENDPLRELRTLWEELRSGQPATGT